MNVQELIDQLQAVPDKTLPVCASESDDYWGVVYNEIDDVKIDPRAQPDGPKEPYRTAVVLS